MKTQTAILFEINKSEKEKNQILGNTTVILVEANKTNESDPEKKARFLETQQSRSELTNAIKKKEAFLRL